MKVDGLGAPVSASVMGDVGDFPVDGVVWAPSVGGTVTCPVWLLPYRNRR